MTRRAWGTVRNMIGDWGQSPDQRTPHKGTVPNRIRIWGLSPVLLFLLLAAAPHAQKVPGRIISIVPAATEMLFAIGAGARVVAVSSFDREPPEVRTLPNVGALLDPDVERILSLRPDLVVVYGTQRDLSQQLERAGIPRFGYVHGGLSDILSTLTALGAATGDTDGAQRVVTSLRASLDAIRAKVAGRIRPRTLLVFGHEPGTLRNLYASGGVGFLHDMLDVAGGEDVFADIARESVQATTEQLIARAPDVIIELRADDEALPDVDAWNVVPSIPAVRNHRVVILAGSEMVTAGPRVAKATERLARALHPGVF
jgi:ABC-type Fe3+-hydroxamate transport system substrate-binding protein